MTENKNLVLRAEDPVGHENTAKHLFLDISRSLEVSLPSGISKELLINAALNSIRKNPKLLKCTQASMVSALLYCAQMGMVPDDPAQDCHLIPFKNKKTGLVEVQWMAGYRGLQRLARRSREVAYVEAEVVHKKDHFVYRKGVNKDIEHIPYEGPDDPGPATHYYAIVRWDGIQALPLFEVMTQADVDKIRAASPGKNSDAWAKHPEQMGRKCPVRRVMKFTPMSREAELALDLDNRADSYEAQPLHNVVAQITEGQEIKPKESATDKLAKTIDATEEEGEGHRTLEECVTLRDENKEVLPPEYIKAFPNDRLMGYSPEGLDVWYATTEEKIAEALEHRGSGLPEAEKGTKGPETGEEETTGESLQTDGANA